MRLSRLGVEGCAYRTLRNSRMTIAGTRSPASLCKRCRRSGEIILIPGAKYGRMFARNLFGRTTIAEIVKGERFARHLFRAS